MALRGADGSFVDNPMMGPHVGTAFALLAFQALKKTERR
jgi:hypothetical protein